MKKDYYVQALEMLIYTLDTYPSNIDKHFWITWLKQDIEDWKLNHEVSHHSKAYGGSGSFNDIVFMDIPKDTKEIFDSLKSFCYQFAFFYKRIHKELEVLEKEILYDVIFGNQNRKTAVYTIEGLQSGDFVAFYKNQLIHKTIIDIKFTRDSVCMGDDVMDNSRTYQCNINSNYESIITIAKAHHFLANVSGNNVVWVVYNHLHKEVLSYYTKADKVIRIMNKHIIDEVSEGEYTLHFRYIVSPKVRKEQLMESYNYKMREMYIDGLGEELELCDKLGE